MDEDVPPTELTEDDATLPGENLASTLLDDIDHWANVYQELVTTLAPLIEQLKREEVSEDLKRLQNQLERAEERLRYWRHRLASPSKDDRADHV